jgi:hypothetical protein
MNFTFLLLLLTLLPFVQAAYKELNVGLAEVLCNSSCSFFDPLIWQNEMVPEDDDDVLILYTGSPRPLTINIESPITLSNLDMEGNVALFVNASSFTVKTAKLIGIDYTSELQINSSSVNMRSLVVNNADFISAYSDIMLDYMSATNGSVILVATQLSCSTCHLGDTSTDSLSSFVGHDITLSSAQTVFKGPTNLTNLVVDSKAVFYNAYLSNVTIQLNANIIGHGILEIDGVTLRDLSMVVTYNASYVNIAPYSNSFISGQGSFVFQATTLFSFGNADVFQDLSGSDVQLLDGNIGTFTNIAFGALLVSAPASVVILDLNLVTFTQPTVIFGKITASGLNIEKALTVYGPLSCTDGITSIGQLMSTRFTQVGGSVELSVFITTEEPVTFTRVNFTATSTAKIDGNVLFSSSTVNLNQPLVVMGDWVSDADTEIMLPCLTPNVPPRLNVSGDFYINGTVKFAIDQAPTSRTEYPLFTYGGILKGPFISNFTVPIEANGDFNVEYTDGAVTLIYTPHKKKDELRRGPALYGAIAGILVLIALLIFGAIVIKRLFTKRQYRVIPS